MRILLLAHYFPPDGGPGTQRPTSFVRHLSAAGDEVVVVTRGLERVARSMLDPLDASMLHGLDAVRIERADRTPSVSWHEAIAAKATEVCRSWKPDIVLATLSPFEHAATARMLGDATAARVVLDLRDPWVLDGWTVHRHVLEYWAELARMRRALASADGVVANVPGARAAFERLVPRVGRVGYTVVTNGWEEADFPVNVPVSRGDEWRLRMSGTFVSTDFVRHSLLKRAWRTLRVSGERIDGRGRSPFFLLAALQSLRAEGHACGRDALLEIAGTVDAQTQRLIDESGFADRVRVHGFLPHAQSTHFVAQAHALVLPMHDLPRGGRARMVPGKYYEYLASGRPILGLVPQGDAKDWIDADPRSRSAAPCSTAAIRAALIDMHAAWSRGDTEESPRPAMAADFTRARQAANLRAYLQEVLDAPRHSA